MSSLLEAPPRRPGLTGANGTLPPAPPRGGGGDDGDEDPRQPRPLLDNAVLATMFLVTGEIMFFGGLMAAFFVLRLGASAWPPPLQPRLPVEVTGLNTLVLLASSVAVAAGVRAARWDDRRSALRRLGLGAGLGALFLVVQGTEWARLVRFGLTMSSSTYGATFYTLIGVHAAHVAGALLWLSVTWLAVAAGRAGRQRSGALRACGLYWHFVVALWPILYVAVYLL